MGVHSELLVQVWHDYFRTYKVGKGDIVVDVGAHTGNFVDIALKQNPTTIIAIEPSPPNYRKLCRRFKNSSVVTCIEKAVWFRLGQIYFNAQGREQDNVNVSYIPYLQPYVKQDKLCVVECDMLDNICKSLPRVDFLKIDVEGSEIAVLLGAVATLQKTGHVAIAIYQCDKHAQVVNHEVHIKCLERILQTHGFTTTINQKKRVLCGDK